MLSLSHSAELCRLLSEPARLRLLALLAQEELTVAELTRVTRLTQSRVSSHLGKLREANLVRDRRQGSSTFYSLSEGRGTESLRRVWELVRTQTADPIFVQDAERVAEVLQSRDGGSWAESVAGRMHRHYSPGRTWESGLRALLGLTRLERVLDVASGDGVLAELIAPRAREVVCLDQSPRVVAAGRARLAHLGHVTCVVGDMHHLPFRDGGFDAVLLLNALTYAHDPLRALTETARVLRPGGSLVASTLKAHPHRDIVDRYNHVACGFEPEQLAVQLRVAGLEVELCERSCRENRPPHFEIITVHARRVAPHPQQET